VIADGAAAAALAQSTSVCCTIGPALDVEELSDAVWRAHQATLDARAARR
jgi:hypothetical protein